MTLSIRNVSNNDLQTISEIELLCFPLSESGSIYQFEQRIKTYPESFFIAEINNQIAGYIHGASTNTLDFNDDLYKDVSYHAERGIYQLVLGLAVLPQYRNNSVGENLILHMTSFAKAKKKEKIILTCKDRLISYYEKFGYINQGPSKSNLGDTLWNDMILSL